MDRDMDLWNALQKHMGHNVKSRSRVRKTTRRTSYCNVRTAISIFWVLTLRPCVQGRIVDRGIRKSIPQRIIAYSIDCITKFVYNFTITEGGAFMPTIKSSADLRNNYNEYRPTVITTRNLFLLRRMERWPCCNEHWGIRGINQPLWTI